jgi:hypothetical protein
MRKNVIVNKGTKSKSVGNLELVDGGFVRNYGGMVAIGYISNNTERYLSVTLKDLRQFMKELDEFLYAQHALTGD